jgi:hypothetical protein
VKTAHEAVSRRPPISFCTIVARTHAYTYDATVWDSSLVQGAVSVSQTSFDSRTFPIAVYRVASLSLSLVSQAHTPAVDVGGRGSSRGQSPASSRPPSARRPAAAASASPAGRFDPTAYIREREERINARRGNSPPPPAPPHPTCPTQLTRERTPTCVQRHSKVANRTRRIAVQIPVHTQTQVRSTTPPLTGAGHVRGGWT